MDFGHPIHDYLKQIRLKIRKNCGYNLPSVFFCVRYCILFSAFAEYVHNKSKNCDIWKAPSVIKLTFRLITAQNVMDKEEDVSNLYSESPWLPRVNVTLERDSLVATRCQSYSPLISPWVVKNRVIRKPIRSTSSEFTSSNWKSDELSFKSPVRHF